VLVSYRRAGRIAVAALPAILGLIAGTSVAAASTVEIGNNLTAPEVLLSNCHPCSAFQSVEGGSNVEAPVDGSVTSWSYRSGDVGAEYSLQVLIPEAGKYGLRAESPGITVEDGNSEHVKTVKLSSPLPIRAHDVVALHVSAGAQGVPTFPSGSADDAFGEISPGAPGTVNLSDQEQLMLRVTISSEASGGGGSGGGGSTGEAKAPAAPMPALAQLPEPSKVGPGVLLSAAATQIPAGQTAASYTFQLGSGAVPVTCPGQDPVLDALVANSVNATATVTVATSSGSSASTSVPISNSLAGLPTVKVKGAFGTPVKGRVASIAKMRRLSARRAALALGPVQMVAAQCLPASASTPSQRKSQSVKGVKIGELAATLETLNTSGCANTVKVGIIEGLGCFTKVSPEHPMPAAEEKILCTHYILGCAVKERLSQPSSLAGLAAASSSSLHARPSEAMLEFTDVGFDAIYYSTQPVRMDGVEIDPVNGGSIVLARAGSLHSGQLKADSAYLISSDAVVKVAGIPVSLHVPDYAGAYKQAQGAAECGKKVAEGLSENHLAATNCLGSVKVPTLPQVEHLIPTVDGPIDLGVDPKSLGVELGEFTIPGGASPLPLIPELPLTGTIKVSLTGFDSASLAVHLELPGVLSDSSGHGLTGDTTLELSNKKGLQLDFLHIKVPSLAQLGLSRLKNLEFTYKRATSLFEGKGTLDLNDLINGEVTLSMAFEHGSFKHAHADYTAPPGGGYPLFGPVFLTYVGADVGINPTTIAGQANLAIGPAVLAKCGAVGVQGTVKLVFGNPFTLDTTGNVQVLCANFGYSSRFHADSDGHVGFGLGIAYPIPGLGSISGELYGQAYVNLKENLFAAQIDGQAKAEFAVKKCESIGPVEECTPTVDFTQSANATISIGDANGKAIGGAGICTHLSFPVLGGFDVGAGTNDLPGTILGAASDNIAAIASRFQILLGNCSLSPFRLLPPPAGISSVHGRGRTAASGYTIHVDPNTGTEVVGLQGSGGAPQVTLTGPGGQEVHAITDGIAVSKYGLSVRQLATGQTLIEIPKAAAGDWTLQSAPGSPPIKTVEVAKKLPEPRITAHVSGRGSKRKLHYTLTAQPGLTVKFVEEVDGGATPIGTARASHGTLSFEPSLGSVKARTISAQIIRSGQLTAIEPVARYTPGKLRPGRPSRIQVRRSHGGWVISFKPGSDTTEHLVTVHLADGAQLLFAVTGKRHAVTIGASLDRSRPTGVQIVGLRGSLRGPAATVVSRVSRRRK
jgi:hypothetical protein